MRHNLNISVQFKKRMRWASFYCICVSMGDIGMQVSVCWFVDVLISTLAFTLNEVH